MQFNFLTKVTVPIFLVWLTLVSNTISVNGQNLPKPPNTGTPSGNTRPGTTRPETNCPQTSQTLSALVANNGSDLTSAEFPTIWFYIPYTSKQISEMEFFLFDANERQTLYHTSITPNEKPGMIEVSLPAQSKYALKLNETYRWRFNLDCQPDNTVEPDLVVDGWIQRVSVSASDNQSIVNLQDYYAKRDRGIWYDAIDGLAELYFANPEAPEVKAAWSELLELLDIQDINP